MSVALMVSDLCTVRIWCSNAEQASVNTLYYEVTAVGGSPATDQDFADELDTGFLSTALPPMINNLSVYNGVQVQIKRSTGLFVAADATAGTAPGTGGAIALPRQTAGLTHWRTPFAGRQFRGRSYWPFPSAAADTGDGVPTGAYVTLVSTIQNAFLNFSSVSAGGRTATVQLVMVHRPPKAGLTPPPTPINVVSTGPKWATQRRRGSFGRANVSPI